MHRYRTYVIPLRRRAFAPLRARTTRLINLYTSRTNIYLDVKRARPRRREFPVVSAAPRRIFPRACRRRCVVTCRAYRAGELGASYVPTRWKRRGATKSRRHDSRLLSWRPTAARADASRTVAAEPVGDCRGREKFAKKNRYERAAVATGERRRPLRAGMSRPR